MSVESGMIRKLRAWSEAEANRRKEEMMRRAQEMRDYQNLLNSGLNSYGAYQNYLGQQGLNNGLGGIFWPPR